MDKLELIESLAHIEKELFPLFKKVGKSKEEFLRMGKLESEAEVVRGKILKAGIKESLNLELGKVAEMDKIEKMVQLEMLEVPQDEICALSQGEAVKSHDDLRENADPEAGESTLDVRSNADQAMRDDLREGEEAVRPPSSAMPRLDVNRINVPEKFPPGCDFVASFSGDDYVRFPDGKVFKLEDSGETMREVGSLPRSGAPMSEDGFLSSARGCREFIAWKYRSANSQVGNQVSTPKQDAISDGLGYLVTNFGKRADIPEGAVLTKMLPEVGRNLAALGLHEPVSLQSLSGKWWLAHVDAACYDSRMESGCGMFTRIVSTEGLVRGYDGYYCEVAAGPFDCKDDVK